MPVSGTTRALIELAHTDVDRDGTHSAEAVKHWMEQFKIGECVVFSDKTGGPWRIDAYEDQYGDPKLVLILYAGRDVDHNPPHLWTRPEVLQVLQPSRR